MRKLLRISDYLLLSAAFAGDFLEFSRSGWGAVPAVMRNMYGYVPSNWKYASYTSKVSKFLATGNIRKVVDKRGVVYLELTSQGKNEFKRRFPVLLQSKKWDGKFMIVIFDIPERNRKLRDNLRYKLESLGFGMLQKSVYISPYHFEEDMREFLAKEGLRELVFVLTARKLLIGNFEVFAQKVWKLEKINKGYAEVISLLSETKKPKVKTVKKALGMYLNTLLTDPLLPNEFLPNTWLRTGALRMLNQIRI